MLGQDVFMPGRDCREAEAVEAFEKFQDNVL